MTDDDDDRGSRLTPEGVIERVRRCLRGHDDLLDGFRAFLPEVRDETRRDGRETRRRHGDDAKTTMARDDEGAVTDGDARRAGRGAGILDGDGDGERDARARTTGDVERARKTEKGAERAGGGDEARMRGARATATRARRARGGERDADRRGEKSAGVGGTL